MVINITVILLCISLVIALFLILKTKEVSKNNNLMKYFLWINILLIIYILPLIFQIMFSKQNINSLYFDYITYIGLVFVPILFFAFSREYTGKQNINKNIRYYFILPIISLLIIWTSDFHQMFYARYSTVISETEYGPYSYIHMLYTYGILILAFINVIVTSIRKSGFLSMPTFLLISGALAPLIPNVLGSLKIISISIYVTPISFIITSLIYYIAIFKLKALNITPIALKTITNTMSDAFVVISNDGTIVDKNLTFEKIFNSVLNINKEENLFEIFKKSKLIEFEELKKHIEKTRIDNKMLNEEYHLIKGDFDKYFEVDIQPIKANSGNDYIGTLLLFKDITQHKLDMVELEEKQNIIVKQGQLVSIGELAGGVAHDINTPIAAIKTGIVMLSSMTSERTDQEKEIIFRMDNCANKIITIVNSMRNQIRNLGGDTDVDFKISSVLKDIKIITYNEISKNRSDVVIDIKDDVSIKGDPTKLGQVFTNLVVNAAQAYGEDNGGKIIISVEEDSDGKNALVKVIDFAGGIDVKISPFVFKNILTTKGIKGTGLGLYLVYSVIVGSFKGDISFDSSLGNGTTFFIKIPKSSEKEENQITVESKTGVEVDDVGEVINKDENKEQKENNENDKSES